MPRSWNPSAGAAEYRPPRGRRGRHEWRWSSRRRQLGTARRDSFHRSRTSGQGIDFYFAFGVIAVTAGVAAPLTILAGAVATILLAFVVAEFTKAEPSAGAFIDLRRDRSGTEGRSGHRNPGRLGRVHGGDRRRVHHVRRMVALTLATTRPGGLRGSRSSRAHGPPRSG